MANENSPLHKLDVAVQTLDRLAEAPPGRGRCGYIWVLTQIVEDLRNDILIMEDKIKMAEKGEQNNGTQEENENREA